MTVDTTVICTRRCWRISRRLGIDCLGESGGDDTLSSAAHLDRQGVK